MSTQNPLVPEGAMPPSKGKANVRIAIFTILAIHVVLIGGLLIQGCKPSTKSDLAKQDSPASELPPITSPEATAGTLPVADTTTIPAAAPAVATVPTALPTAAPVAAATAAPAMPALPEIAPAMPAVTTIPAGEVKIHSVAKGEMLSTIAKSYHVTLKALLDANPSVNPTRLQIGQKLNIPAAAPKAESVAAAAPADAADVYTVKSGDMLEKIAKANGTTAKELMRINNLKSANRIMPGQKLKLPAKAAPAAASASAPFTVPTPVAAAPSATVVR